MDVRQKHPEMSEADAQKYDASIPADSKAYPPPVLETVKADPAPKPLKHLSELAKDDAAFEPILNFIYGEKREFDEVCCYLSDPLEEIKWQKDRGRLINAEKTMEIRGLFMTGEQARKLRIEPFTGKVITDRNYNPFEFVRLLNALGYTA